MRFERVPEREQGKKRCSHECPRYPRFLSEKTRRKNTCQRETTRLAPCVEDDSKRRVKDEVASRQNGFPRALVTRFDKRSSRIARCGHQVTTKILQAVHLWGQTCEHSFRRNRQCRFHRFGSTGSGDRPDTKPQNRLQSAR